MNRWQIPLRRLGLVITVIVLVVAWIQSEAQLAKMSAYNHATRKLLNELQVDDPSRYAATAVPANDLDQYRWDVYLPAGGTYRLALGEGPLDAIETQLPPRVADAAIASGRHRIIVYQRRIGETLQYELQIDDQIVIDCKSSLPIIDNLGWSLTGISRCEQLPIDAPLILQRRRINRSLGPNQSTSEGNEPRPGAAVWIERQP